MHGNDLSPFNYNYHSLNKIESQTHYRKKDNYSNYNNIQRFYNKKKKVKKDEFLYQEYLSSIDNILGNLTNSSPNINIPDNISYISKPNLFKTPKKYINKKIFLNNSPNITNFDYGNNFLNNNDMFSNEYKNKSNNNLLRHTTNFNKRNKTIFKDYINDNNIYYIHNKNKSGELGLETQNNLKNKNLYHFLLKDLNKIKQKNIINKNEIARFKNDFFKMQKILLKGVEEYFKTIKINNIKQKQLEKELNEYKIKYNNLLYNKKNNNNNIIKEINEEKKKFEIELNDNKNKEIKEITNKYENKMKEQNENIEQLNFEINALKLGNKNLSNQIKQQQIKNKIENININNIGNFKKNDLFKELEGKKNEIKVLKQKNLEILKKLENRTQKSPIKLNIQEETINKENNLNENKKLISTINVLKSQNNNLMKEYFKYKEIAEKSILEKKEILKERDIYKKKSAELFNEIKIIKMNNDRMNNIKIRNNILINNNLLIKSKANSFSSEKDKYKDKEKSSSKNKIPFKKMGNFNVNQKRSKSVKTKLKLNKHNYNDSGNLNENDSLNNSKNKKFDVLKLSTKIINICIKGEKMNKNDLENDIPNNKIKNIQQENNSNLGNDENKNLKSDKIDNLEMNNKIKENFLKEKEKIKEIEKKYNKIIEK